jgi:GNAT superfamily N-acetyltransferase
MLRLLKAYLDFYERPYPPDENLHRLLDTLADQPARGLQFIAEADGQGVGFATLYSTFSTLRAQEAMVLNDLFVDPHVRGAGIGHELFETCRRHVEQNGYAFLEWVTAPDNTAAQRFYERHGATRSPWLVYSL